jgi:uncharacterized protein
VALSRGLELRNGWWMLIFVALFLLSRVAYTPLVRWLKSLGADDLLLQPMPFVFVLLVTWICLALRRERLADVGLRADRAWWRQAAIGCVIGIASAAMAVALVLLADGARLVLDPQRSFAALLIGAHSFLFVSLFEELLFRGFLFQRLIAGSRPWIALVVFALLFAFSHWGNPEMDGITRWIATIEIALAAVLLGLAYLRTGSLALPIGLHLGWNWAQGSLFGFGVSGLDQAGWWQPQLPSQPVWINGGGFGLEASIFAIAVDLLPIVLLWRWRGLPRRGEPPRVAAA